MDSIHEELVQRLVDIKVSIGIDDTLVFQKLKDLSSECKKHFAEEESMMIKVGYPAHGHIENHEKIMRKLSLLIFMAEFPPFNADHHISSLHDYLAQHVLNYDKAFFSSAEWLNKKNRDV